MEELHCFLICILSAVAKVYKTLCTYSAASFRCEVSFVIINAVDIYAVFVQPDRAASAEMCNDECAFIEFLPKFFLCTFNGHCSGVEGMTYSKVREFRDSADSCYRHLLVCSDCIVNAYRYSKLFVQIECDHASDE